MANHTDPHLMQLPSDNSGGGKAARQQIAFISKTKRLLRRMTFKSRPRTLLPTLQASEKVVPKELSRLEIALYSSYDVQCTIARGLDVIARVNLYRAVGPRYFTSSLVGISVRQLLIDHDVPDPDAMLSVLCKSAFNIVDLSQLSTSPLEDTAQSNLVFDFPRENWTPPPDNPFATQYIVEFTNVVSFIGELRRQGYVALSWLYSVPNYNYPRRIIQIRFDSNIHIDSCWRVNCSICGAFEVDLLPNHRGFPGYAAFKNGALHLQTHRNANGGLRSGGPMSAYFCIPDLSPYHDMPDDPGAMSRGRESRRIWNELELAGVTRLNVCR